MSKKNIFTKSIGVLLSLTLILDLSISGYKDVDATELKPDVTMATEYSKEKKQQMIQAMNNRIFRRGGSKRIRTWMQ